MTFYHWLLTQTDRNDPIGDVARDVLGDRTHLRAYCPKPTNAHNHRGIRRHMVLVHQACGEVLDAVDLAYYEYLAITEQ